MNGEDYGGRRRSRWPACWRRASAPATGCPSPATGSRPPGRRRRRSASHPPTQQEPTSPRTASSYQPGRPVPPNTVACSQTITPSVRMTAEVDDPHGAEDHRRRARRLVDDRGHRGCRRAAGRTRRDGGDGHHRADPARSRGGVQEVRRRPDGGIGGQQRQRATRRTVRIQRAEADGRMVGYAAERRRIRGPHRPCLDQQRQQLSRRGARAGPDGNTRVSTRPLRC